jgi:hypothetical protein
VRCKVKVNEREQGSRSSTNSPFLVVVLLFDWFYAFNFRVASFSVIVLSLFLSTPHSSLSFYSSSFLPNKYNI